MELLNATELLVLPDVERKLKIISLDSLEVLKEFEGRVPKRSNTFRVVKERKGSLHFILWCMTKEVFLYPRHLCRRVNSFRFSVRPFVC